MAPFALNKGQSNSKVSTFKIYLSNLPDDLKNNDIQQLFEEFGRTVECEVFKRNFGFVHMEEEECGRAAVQALNKKELNGKNISVSISKNTEPPNVDTTKLFVKNLPVGTHASRLRQLFKKFGLVLEAEVTGNTYGVVSLEAIGDIRTAINEMNGFDLDGNTLIVEPLKLSKAERYGQVQLPAPQMEWNPKPAPAYAAHSRASHGYSLGGGYGPSAQIEEFYGNPAEDYYYEEEEDYNEYEPAEYAAPRRYPNAVIPPPGLRPGIDYVRRNTTFYNDAYARQPQSVSRNPPPRPIPAYARMQEYEGGYYPPPATYYSGKRKGGGRGRGGRGSTCQSRPAPVAIPPRRKVARGEPYPAPPGPNPMALLAQSVRGVGAKPRAPTMTGLGLRPKTRGGGVGLLAAARAQAAAAAAAAPSEPDPFAPSAVERKLMLQHIQADSNIDFTADILLT